MSYSCPKMITTIYSDSRSNENIDVYPQNYPMIINLHDSWYYEYLEGRRMEFNRDKYVLSSTDFYEKEIILYILKEKNKEITAINFYQCKNKHYILNSHINYYSYNNEDEFLHNIRTLKYNYRYLKERNLLYLSNIRYLEFERNEFVLSKYLYHNIFSIKKNQLYVFQDISDLIFFKSIDNIHTCIEKILDNNCLIFIINDNLLIDNIDNNLISKLNQYINKIVPKHNYNFRKKNLIDNTCVNDKYINIQRSISNELTSYFNQKKIKILKRIENDTLTISIIF